MPKNTLMAFTKSKFLTSVDLDLDAKVVVVVAAAVVVVQVHEEVV